MIGSMNMGKSKKGDVSLNIDESVKNIDKTVRKDDQLPPINLHK